MFIFPQPVWQKTFRKKNPGSLNISENPKFPNFHKHVIFVTSDLFFSQGFLQNGGVFSPTKRFRRLPATGVILGPLRQYSIWEVPGNDVMRPLWPTFYRSGLEGLEGRGVSTGFWELGKKTTSGWTIEIKGWMGWESSTEKCTWNNPESQGLPESFALPKSTEIWENHLMSGGEKTSQVGESNGALCGHWFPCFHIKCFWEPTSGFLKSWEYDLQLNTTWILQFQIVKIVKRISRADFFRTK